MANKKSTFVLFSSLFLIMLGFGIIIPVLPFYSADLGATSLHLGLLMASYSVMQFIFAPVWGALSDRWGRRPVLLIGIGGFAVSFFIFGLANALWVLFAARIMGGLLSSAAMPVVMAVISDTTTEDKRAKGMGMIGAAMGLGMIFGPAVGGLLAGFGNHVPFMVAAGMALATMIYATIFMPETLDRTKVRAEHGKRLSFLNSLKGPLAFLMILAFAISAANASLEAVLAYYAKDIFGYGAPQMGLAFTVMGIASVILQGFLVGRIVSRFGEQKVIVFGLALSVMAFVLITEAGGLATLTAYLVFAGIGQGLVRPGITSLISKKTAAGQGETMGTMSAFDSMGRIVGPVYGGQVYLLHHTYPFLAGALILAAVMVAAILKFRLTKQAIPSYNNPEK